MPREDNLTHEQQRFAVPRPVQDDKPRPFAQPLKPQPAAEKPDEPEIEDFLVSVPPRTERQPFMSAPPLGNFKPDPSRAIGRIKPSAFTRDLFRYWPNLRSPPDTFTFASSAFYTVLIK